MDPDLAVPYGQICGGDGDVDAGSFALSALVGREHRVGIRREGVGHGMIDRAAEMGGANALFGKLEKGKKTRLETGNEAYGYNVPDEPSHPLQVELEKMQKNISLSGGEMQRIVA